MVDHADADDHDGKHRGRQGRAEQGGEERRHARQGGYPEVPVIHLEMPPKELTDGAAHLQGRALPSGAAAAQVGQDGAEKDGRQQQNGQEFALVHRINDIVGAQAVGFRQLIETHDHQARQGQQIQHPGVCAPESCHLMDAEVEQCADEAADAADHSGHRRPLDKGPPVKAPTPRRSLQFFGIHSHNLTFQQRCRTERC